MTGVQTCALPILALREDQGGSTVIRRHPEELLLFEAPGEELEDVDTAAALRSMERLV